MENILLTGRPGIGKTTVIQRVLEGISAKVGGFYTREIREGRVRTGFRIASLDGEEGILAQRDFQSKWRVGKYGVSVGEMERVGVAALERALRESDLIVVDEIGRMELFSKQFREIVLQCLDSPRDVLGTIQKKSLPFLDAIRARQDVTLMEVTARNRDELAETIINRWRNERV